MIALLISVVFILSAHSFVVAILGAWARPRKGNVGVLPTTGECCRILVLVPAYNEGEYLRPTLRNLSRIDYPSQCFRVVVIADNCTDNTALVAEEEECEVWVRCDPDRRGKGYALDWAMHRKEIRTYDAAVVVDADTAVPTNLLNVLDRELRCGQVAIQVASDFEFSSITPPWLSIPARGANSAYERYIARPRSDLRLYQGLHGTGFCLSTKVLDEVPWTARSVCEDLEYGFELSQRGIAIRFVEGAVVTSTMTGKIKHARGQRKRWSGGTYALILRLLPRLFLKGVRTKDWRSIEACVYLMVRSRVPLMLLTAVTAALLSLTWRHVTVSWLSFLGIALLLQGTYLLLVADAAKGRNGFWSVLWWLCKYVAWGCVSHFHALLNLRRAVWNRTERG